MTPPESTLPEKICHYCDLDCKFAYGLCHCGCGQETLVAKSTHTSKEARKGECNKFIHGHHSTKKFLSPGDSCVCLDKNCAVPYGYCHCGCGKKTRIYKGSNFADRKFKDKPAMHILGHAKRAARKRTDDDHYNSFKDRNPSENEEWTKSIEFRRKYILKEYGIAPPQFASMMDECGGRCSICRTENPNAGKEVVTKYFDIDHDHETGQVRGLLCRRCNSALGFFGDSVSVLREALAYLEKWQARQCDVK